MIDRTLRADSRGADKGALYTQYPDPLSTISQSTISHPTSASPVPRSLFLSYLPDPCLALTVAPAWRFQPLHRYTTMENMKIAKDNLLFYLYMMVDTFMAIFGMLIYWFMHSD